jgi:VIT1/CCC1 family predicted Fe2+/Mn2+ transporter
MEILFVYLIIGVLLSTLIYALADSHPWYFFVSLCIAWLPLIFIGMIISLFMDLEEISNKLNR